MRARSLLLLAAIGFALAAVVTYLLAIHTAQGLHDDSALFRRVSGNGLPQVQAAGSRALSTIDRSSLIAGAIALALLATLRGRILRGVIAVAVIVFSIGSVELLKHELPFPTGRPATFPSGHAAVAASLGLALVLAVPSLARPVASVIGAAYTAAISLSVVALGWHYPSDVVGSLFICGAWASLGGLATAGGARRPTISLPGLAATLVALAIVVGVGAALGFDHHAGLAAIRSRKSLLGTTVVMGFVSALTFSVVTPLVAE